MKRRIMSGLLCLAIIVFLFGVITFSASAAVVSVGCDFGIGGDLCSKGEETIMIRSDTEKHFRYSDPPQEDSAEDQRDKRFTGHLNKYYNDIISCVRDAEFILILGPGKATIKLKKRLESETLSGYIVGIETIDKMTDRQITAQVRQYFLRQSPAIG
jgi:hypothetical protein